MSFGSSQASLELLATKNGVPVEHKTAFGRIAFSVKASQLPDLQSKMEENGQTILTHLVSLDTPGKATVSVVILADPVSKQPPVH